MYLRHNAFVVLYPVAIAGELLSAYRAWYYLSGLELWDKPYLLDWRPDFMTDAWSWIEACIKWYTLPIYALFIP